MTAKRYPTPCFSPVGDCAMLVELGSGIDASLNELVLQLEEHILKLAIHGVEETTPSYCSLLLHYNPDVISFAALQDVVSTIDLDSADDAREAWLWRVPVCYGGEYGEDLETVAEYHHLSSEEVIRLHSAPRYRVYMIGFAPGYTYLGGLDPQLHTPRRDNPRLITPQGSISIGGMQALIAGIAMPSGWQLLGRTPVATYSRERDPPFLINAGDAVEFHAIEPREFQSMQRSAQRGEWVASREPLADSGASP